jgi:ubiquitin C-terminal hydrolase
LFTFHIRVSPLRADVWLLFDDDKVKVSSTLDVLNSEAYLLFYAARPAA